MKSSTKRKLKYGGFATLVTVIFIVAVLIVNFIADKVTDKFGLRADLTAGKSFNISETSRDYVAALDKDVEIIVLEDEYDYGNEGEIYAQAASILSSYTYASKRITLTYHDIVSDPTFLKQFPDIEPGTGEFVVRCGSRVRHIKKTDMFIRKMNSAGTGYDYYTDVEGAVTRAIAAVTSESLPKIAILNGYDGDDTAALGEVFKNNNYDVVNIELATEEIDPEAQMAVLVGPKVKLPAEAVKKIENFLDNGGKQGKAFFYFVSYDATAEHQTELDALLYDWGINVDYGYVFETNGSKMASATSPFSVVADIVDTASAGNVTGKNIILAMINSRYLTLSFDAKGSYTTKTLAEFSQTAGVLPEDAGEDYTITAADICGPMPAFAKSTYTRYEGTVANESNIIVCATSSVCDSSVLSLTNLADAEYVKALADDLTDNESPIYIRPVSLNTEAMVTTTAQKNTVRIIFVYAIPAVVVLCGLAVFIKRRHK